MSYYTVEFAMVILSLSISFFIVTCSLCIIKVINGV
jgi:hypothetical protein